MLFPKFRLYSQHFIFFSTCKMKRKKKQLLPLFLFLMSDPNTLFLMSVWSEPIPDPGGPADLHRSVYVYIRVYSVRAGGIHHGAPGVLHRGDPLDPHPGPHAEGRAGSVLSHCHIENDEYIEQSPNESRWTTGWKERQLRMQMKNDESNYCSFSHSLFPDCAIRLVVL